MSEWPALRAALAKRQRAAKIGSVVIVVMALGLTGALYAISDNPRQDRAVVKAFLQGGLLILGGLIYMVWAFAHKPEKHKLLRALREDPEQVVWIYETTINHQRHLAVALRNKKRHQIPVENEAQFAALWAEVTQAAPHANLGWSERKNKAFAKDPLRLLDPEAGY